MVLALYYQDEMTFKEIGQVLGVTESRVCQIHTEAVLALRGRLVDPDVAARLGPKEGAVMIRGFYTALSGDHLVDDPPGGRGRQHRQHQHRRLQAIPDRPGRLRAPAHELARPRDRRSLAPAPSRPGLKLDTSQGPLQVTGGEADLAVQGDGLFVVRTGGGVAYTRAGDFTVDVTGTLVTQQGYPVLDTAGHTIQPGHPFTVAADGTIVQTGQRIALMGWPPGGVTRLGENLYSAGGQLAPATGTIRQGALEASNTDMAMAMTDLVSLQRNFQMSSRALSLQDGTLADATQLGRLR